MCVCAQPKDDYARSDVTHVRELCRLNTCIKATTTVTSDRIQYRTGPGGPAWPPAAAPSTGFTPQSTERRTLLHINKEANLASVIDANRRCAGLTGKGMCILVDDVPEFLVNARHCVFELLKFTEVAQV